METISKDNLVAVIGKRIPNSFKPTELTIKIENEEQLKELWIIFNSPESNFDNCKGEFKTTDVNTHRYWRMVNHLAYKFGLTERDSYNFTNDYSIY
ncbi:MAG: hypothetical protein PVI03_04015 [Candidatus Thorarchaeota archaeon]|jgi:hypothetical protein